MIEICYVAPKGIVMFDYSFGYDGSTEEDAAGTCDQCDVLKEELNRAVRFLRESSPFPSIERK